MYKTIATMILLAALHCVAAQTNEGDPKASATLATAHPLSLPKDAAANADGTFVWTDKQGKSWIYRRTEGGFLRSPAPASSSHAVQIPKDAVANPDGSYTWTDKSGKAWVFINTPFGVMKNPAPATASPSAAATTNVKTKVIDKGDTVRFETPSPFGMTGYEKRKPDLSDEERRLYEASKAKPE